MSPSSLPEGYEIIDINTLRQHEEVNREYLEQLKKEIDRDGLLKKAIIVDNNTLIILDGHHRFRAILEMGFNKIPALKVDYNDPKIRVTAWREGEIVSKETVLEAGLKGKKLPVKTSRHTLPYEMEDIDYPLKKLQ